MADANALLSRLQDVLSQAVQLAGNANLPSDVRLEHFVLACNSMQSTASILLTTLSNAANLEQENRDLQAEITGLRARLQTINDANSANVAAIIAQKDAQIAKSAYDYEAEIEVRDQQIANRDQQIATLTPQVDQLQKDKQSLQKSLEQIKGTPEYVAAKTAELQAVIDSAQQTVAAATQQLESLGAARAKLEETSPAGLSSNESSAPAGREN